MEISSDNNFTNEQHACATLVDLLCMRARMGPATAGFSFLSGGEEALDRVTFQKIHASAQAVAVHLRRLALVQEVGRTFGANWTLKLWR